MVAAGTAVASAAVALLQEHAAACHCWQQRPWRQGERGALADEESNDESLSKTGHDAELAMAMFGLVENDAMRM